MRSEPAARIDGLAKEIDIGITPLLLAKATYLVANLGLHIIGKGPPGILPHVAGGASGAEISYDVMPSSTKGLVVIPMNGLHAEIDSTYPA